MGNFNKEIYMKGCRLITKVDGDTSNMYQFVFNPETAEFSDIFPCGNGLEFELEDTELLLRYYDLIEKDKKNRQWFNNQLIIIKKKEDHRGKKVLSSNEYDILKAYNDFYKKEKEVFDMFLGQGGVDKLLNGRRLGWTTFNEITKIIKEQIAPKLDITMDKVTDKIKNLYKDSIEEETI